MAIMHVHRVGLPGAVKGTFKEEIWCQDERSGILGITGPQQSISFSPTAVSFTEATVV